ncbi:MAG: cytochrome c biogenesis protein [Thermogutta sp.]
MLPVSLSLRRLASVLAVGASLIICSTTGHAVENPRLDLSAWNAIPLWEDGRVKPMDTFARQIVTELCGRESPTLSPPLDAAGTPRKDHPLFPGGDPRRWSAQELLLSWLVEPELWEDVPFLEASHERLRAEILGISVVDAEGRRLKFVSPRDLERAERFQQYLKDLSKRRRELQSRGERFRPLGLDHKVSSLWNSYSRFRLLTFQPRPDAVPEFAANVPLQHPVSMRLGQLKEDWSAIEPQLRQLAEAGAMDAAAQAVHSHPTPNLFETVHSLFQALDTDLRNGATFSTLDRSLGALKKPLHELALTMESLRNRASGAESPPGMNAAQFDSLRGNIRLLTTRLQTLAQNVEAAQVMLYDVGGGPHVLPAPFVSCIVAASDSGEPVSPWISLQAVLYGNWNDADAVLEPFAQCSTEHGELVRKTRRAFEDAAAIYRDRGNPQRSARLAESLTQFSEGLRELGTAIEPIRRTLPLDDSHRDILAATAYPSRNAVATELFYNRFDPFFWSWVVNITAFLAVLLSLGRLRGPLFWTGVALLVVAQAITISGFALRIAITGWAPVTNMFESVLFVSLVTGLLAIWFVTQPIIGDGLREAWKWTAFPLRLPIGGSGRGPGSVRTFASPGRRLVSLIAITPLRVVLSAALFMLLAVIPYDVAKSRAVFDLVPEFARGVTSPSPGDVLMILLGWLVGISILGVMVWGVPRLILSAAISLYTIPAGWNRDALRSAIRHAYARKPYALAGAALAFSVAMIGYFTPVWDRGINALQPVLRDRMWLFAHVLTVTAGYGAGLLAWGLGNLALGYYLFGRYRPAPSGPVTGSDGVHRPAAGADNEIAAAQPPEPCIHLAGYMYKAIQVAVVLLTAGTILGGVWADRAWGRFWGWDPKEVWALVSILVYMVLLHGRYASWIGNFGMAAGSVMGMISVVWAWYGTNYLMPIGLHSYAGEGSGGGLYVVAFFTANLLLVGAARLRYIKETRVTGKSGRNSDAKPRPATEFRPKMEPVGTNA